MSKLVKPQVNSLRDSLDLKFLVLKPLATAINLLSFFKIKNQSILYENELTSLNNINNELK